MLPASLSAVAWSASSQGTGFAGSLKAVLDFIVQFASHTGSDFFRQMSFSQKTFFYVVFVFVHVHVCTWHTYGGRGKRGMSWFPSSAMWGQPLLSVFLSGSLRHASF